MSRLPINQGDIVRYMLAGDMFVFGKVERVMTDRYLVEGGLFAYRHHTTKRLVETKEVLYHHDLHRGIR